MPWCLTISTSGDSSWSSPSPSIEPIPIIPFWRSGTDAVQKIRPEFLGRCIKEMVIIPEHEGFAKSVVSFIR